MKGLKTPLLTAAAIILFALIPRLCMADEDGTTLLVEKLVEKYGKLASQFTETRGLDSLPNFDNGAADKYAITFCMIGEEYLKEKMYYKAMEYFESSLIFKPDYKRAYNGLGRVYKNLGLTGTYASKTDSK